MNFHIIKYSDGIAATHHHRTQKDASDRAFAPYKFKYIHIPILHIASVLEVPRIYGMVFIIWLAWCTTVSLRYKRSMFARIHAIVKSSTIATILYTLALSAQKGRRNLI